MRYRLAHRKNHSVPVVKIVAGRMLLYVALLLLLAGATLPACAQEDAGSANLFRTITFTPEQAMAQGRYNPRYNDTLMTNQQWWRRLYIGVGGGMAGLTDNVSGVTGSVFNFYLGYKFNPVHAVRMIGSVVNYDYAKRDDFAFGMRLGVDYVGSFTNYAWGYNPRRIVDVNFFVGAGAMLMKQELPRKVNPYVHMGVQLEAHLSNFFSVYAEPYVGLQGSMDRIFDRDNPVPVNLIYGVRGGLQLAMEKRADFFTEADTIFRKFFLDISSGATLPTFANGGMHALGSNYQVGVGLWMNPMVGLRIGAQAQTFYRDVSDATQLGVKVRNYKSQMLMGVRGELLFNPLNFVSSWRNAHGGHDFDVNVSVGGDFGWNMRNGVDGAEGGNFRCYYYGLTGGVQALYRISKPGTYIFVEPRYQLTMYSIPYRNTSNSLSVSESSASLSIGTRMYMTQPSFRFNEHNRFSPRCWVGVDFGGVRLQQKSAIRLSGGFNPAVGVTLGYDWKKYATLRLGLSYQNIGAAFVSDYAGFDSEGKPYSGTGLWDNSYSLLDARLGYMLNLNNLLQGYDADRRLNMWLSAGPSLSCVLGEKNDWVYGQDAEYKGMKLLTLRNSHAGKVAPGIFGSVMATVNVWKSMDITAEALAQYNFGNNASPGDGSNVNRIKYGFSLGARYSMSQVQVVDFFKGNFVKPWQKGLQLETSYGWSVPFDTGSGMACSGENVNVGVLYWLNSMLGGRLSLGLQQVYWNKSEVEGEKEIVSGIPLHAPHTLYRTQVMLGGRLEAVLNPVNLVPAWRDRDKAPKWEMNISAGIGVGYTLKMHAMNTSYLGFTTALTGLYRLSNTMQVFLEPRYEVNNISIFNENLQAKESYSDRLFSVNIGARISRPVDRKPAGQEKEDIVHRSNKYKLAHRGLFATVNVGMTKFTEAVRATKGGTALAPSCQVALGWDLNRLHSVRAQASLEFFSRLRPNQPYMINVGDVSRGYVGIMDSKYCMTDVRLQYMLNMTTLWTRKDRRNPWSLYLLAGPVLSTYLSESNTLTEGELMSGGNNVYTGVEYKGKLGYGISFGAMVAYRLNQNWDLTAETMAQYYLNDGFVPQYFTSRINPLKMGFSIGTRFNF